MHELLLLKVGSTFERAKQARGDYEDWFRAALGGRRLRVVEVSAGEALPDPRIPNGVLISGSPAMVTDRAPWSVSTAVWLRERVAHGQGLTLGVCYGHQLLADALGGEVGDNPQGRQVGTVQVELTASARADPLLAELPSPLIVQTSHRQAVLRPPPGSELLARAPRDSYHALRFGERTWGVQFHPEFDADIARSYVEERGPLLATEGLDAAALLAAVSESDHGSRVLQRFAALCDSW